MEGKRMENGKTILLSQKNPKQSEEGILNSIPIEIALKIASSLQVWDVCSLGSCSRFWCELCGSDSVWESLYRQRWPALDPQMKPSLMGWRECYINKQKDIDRFATDVVQQFSCTKKVELGQYLSVIEGMCSMEMGFKDVQMFFFKQNLNVLINLIGLHYCISWLGVPTAYVGEALDSSKISERKACVQRKNIPIRRCGFGYFKRVFSLADIATGNEDRLLGLLRHRVPITGPYRVQISVVKT